MGSTLPSGNALHGVKIVALALALTFAFGVSTAFAVDFTYVPAGSFGSGPGAGAGEMTHPRRAAVDQATGDLYVADRDNNRIVVFRPGTSPAGSFLTQFGSAVLDEPFGVAIDQTTGDVYVSSAGNDRIVKFESDGAPTPSFTVDAGFTSPTLGTGAAQVGDFEADIAVDPGSGDLLVADPGNDLVERFDSTGAHLANFDGSSSPSGAFVGLLDLDVAANGDIYVVDATGPLFVEGGEGGCTGNAYCNRNTSRIVRFDPDGSNGTDVIPSSAEAFGLVTVDPSNGQLLVGEVNPQLIKVLAFRPNGSGPLVVFNRGFEALSAIAAGGPSPRAYVVTDQIFHNHDERDIGQVGIKAYRPASFPTASAVTVSDVSDSGAHLDATVNPNGEATSGRFEYRATGGWQRLPSQDVGNGTAPVAIEADLSQLESNLAYRVRVTAVNSAAAESVSAEASFSTVAIAPDVVARGAAPRTQTAARLNGWILPNNAATTYYFEYGTTTSYGSQLPATPASLGAGGDSIAVSEQLEGLAPGTTYHYRLVAENPSGTTLGEDRAFSTRTPAESGPPARGIELVNNPDKGNQVVIPPEGGPLANADASKILWTTNAGAPGSSTGTGNTFMAQRTEDGWKSTSLLPSADQLVDQGESKYVPKLASPNFSSFVYEITSGILTRVPRKYAVLDTSFNQAYRGELEVTDVSPVVRGSDDFSHIYTNSRTPGGTEQVFDLATSPPSIVSLLPNDEAPSCGVNNSVTGVEWGAGYEWVSTSPAAPARVYFESKGSGVCSGNSSRLYMRDLDAGATTLVSGPALPGGPQGENGMFVRASADGSRAIFVTDSRLTPDDHNDGGDIYRYTVGQGSTCLTCGGPPANIYIGHVRGRMVVASADLSRIYFDSPGLLVPGAGERSEPNGFDQEPSNIYEWHEGQIDYVGSARPTATQEASSFKDDSVQMTDGGRVIFFTSTNPAITTDETGGSKQLYRYSEADTSLECVSCIDGAAHVPVAVPEYALNKGIDDTAENGNAVVFQTTGALVPEDVNGDSDIYEWRDSAVSLVTDGVTQYPQGTGRLELLGVGSDDKNVIFQAGVNLTGYERDSAGQIYVARAGGGFPPPPGKPAPCGEESCQGPLQAPPAESVPGSSSVDGNGNVQEAATPRKRCVAKPRKGARKGAAKKATAKKRACAKRKPAKHRTKHRKTKSAKRKQGGKR